MSKPPTLSAALSRLDRYARDYAEVDGSKQLAADMERVVRGLRLIADAAEHMDDRDALPVFEVMTDCTWLNASKGFLHCVEMAMRNEDLPDGAEGV